MRRDGDETRRDDTTRNETRRNETKRDETGRNGTKRDETRRNGTRRDEPRDETRRDENRAEEQRREKTCENLIDEELENKSRMKDDALLSKCLNCEELDHHLRGQRAGEVRHDGPMQPRKSIWELSLLAWREFWASAAWACAADCAISRGLRSRLLIVPYFLKYVLS